MKLALISPKGAFLGRNAKFAAFWNNSESLRNYKHLWSGTSLGLLIIASLTPKSFDIEFIDENFNPVDYDKDYDIVAITAFTQQAPRAYQIADQFRTRNIFVVIGGIHATLMPHEAKKHANTVIIGEAEELWPKFINDFLNRTTKPFYENKQPVDLSRSPIPRYDLVDPNNHHTAWVQTTRGCPHQCEFCAASSIFGSKYRRKNVKQVEAELSLVKQRWRNPIVIFADDNLFVNKKHSVQIVKILGRLNIKWIAQTDLSIAKENTLLDLLRLNGCIFLFIGFESINPSNSKYFSNKSKLTKIDSYEKAVHTIQSKGIGIMGAFIVGFDHDDKSVFKETCNFIIDNHLYGAQIAILTPLPGTKLRERLELEGRILSNDWSNYTVFDVNFIPKKMSKRELQDGILTMYKTIYSRDVQLRIASHFKNIYRGLIHKQKTP